MEALRWDLLVPNVDTLEELARLYPEEMAIASLGEISEMFRDYPVERWQLEAKAGDCFASVLNGPDPMENRVQYLRVLGYWDMAVDLDRPKSRMEELATRSVEVMTQGDDSVRAFRRVWELHYPLAPYQWAALAAAGWPHSLVGFMEVIVEAAAKNPEAARVRSGASLEEELATADGLVLIRRDGSVNHSLYPRLARLLEGRAVPTPLNTPAPDVSAPEAPAPDAAAAMVPSEKGPARRSWASSDELHRYLQDRGASLDPAEMTRLVAEYDRLMKAEHDAAIARPVAALRALKPSKSAARAATAIPGDGATVEEAAGESKPAARVVLDAFRERCNQDFEAGRLTADEWQDRLSVKVAEVLGVVAVRGSVSRIWVALDGATYAAVRDVVVSLALEVERGELTRDDVLDALEARLKA